MRQIIEYLDSTTKGIESYNSPVSIKINADPLNCNNCGAPNREIKLFCDYCGNPTIEIPKAIVTSSKH